MPGPGVLLTSPAEPSSLPALPALLPLARAAAQPEAERRERAVELVLGRRLSVAAVARALRLRESALRGCVCRAQCALTSRSLLPLRAEQWTEAERFLHGIEHVLSRRASVPAVARELGISASALRGRVARALHERARARSL
ncbi:MAG: hypothetical protein U1A78_17390 [Polyangia bacterium]